MHQIHENNDNKPNTKKVRSQEAYRKHLYNYSKKVVTIIHQRRRAVTSSDL